MRRLVLLLSPVALVAAFFGGRWSRAGAVTQCEERASQLERERDQARSERGSQLASALALASRGLEQARREQGAGKPPPPTVQPEEHTGFHFSMDDAPDGGTANVMSMMFAAKDKAREALDKMQRATRLTSDQRGGLDKSVAAMNLALGDVVERFAKQGGVQKEPRMRDMLPIAIDGLTALKKAEDDFRASLDDNQRRALDEDGFELVSQIDPMIFLRFLTPPDQPPR